MNDPIFIISGKPRREAKKKLAGIKSFIKNFWYFEDIDRVYGGGMDDDSAKAILKKNYLLSVKLEEDLSIKIGQNSEFPRKFGSDMIENLRVHLACRTPDEIKADREFFKDKKSKGVA